MNQRLSCCPSCLGTQCVIISARDTASPGWAHACAYGSKTATTETFGGLCILLSGIQTDDGLIIISPDNNEIMYVLLAS